MKPSELSLFTQAEQTLLVSTESKRLVDLSEDELDDLFARVRRARNKYMKLYRRQSADLVAEKQRRAGTASSNQRTNRKAEIFEDALARVAKALAAAARATSKQLKEERLAAATADRGALDREAPASGRSSGRSAPSSGGKAARGRATSTSRQASRKASGARNQAKRDAR